MYGIYIYIYRERVVVKTETSKQIKKMLPLLSSELAALPSTFRSLFGYEIKKRGRFAATKAKSSRFALSFIISQSFVISSTWELDS